MSVEDKDIQSAIDAAESSTISVTDGIANAENRGRLKLRIFRFLMSCVPNGITEPSVEDIANYADAPVTEVHAVMTSLVRDGVIEWQMFYDCPECDHPNPLTDEQIEVGIKQGSVGQCSECDCSLPVIASAPHLRPQYKLPLWWWRELLPPKVSD